MLFVLDEFVITLLFLFLFLFLFWFLVSILIGLHTNDHNKQQTHMHRILKNVIEMRSSDVNIDQARAAHIQTLCLLCYFKWFRRINYYDIKNRERQTDRERDRERNWAMITKLTTLSFVWLFSILANLIYVFCLWKKREIEIHCINKMWCIDRRLN